MNFLIYALLVLLIVFNACVVFMAFEQICGFVAGKAPSISSGYKSRKAVADEIIKNFYGAETILDIGSGWGSMVRTISKRKNSFKVIGIEIKLAPFIFSWIDSIFRKNVKIIYGNAFKYINDNNKKFDIGITYLLTPEMLNVEKFLSRFKILLVLDFPLPNTEPTKKN